MQSGTNYSFYITKGIDWVNSEKIGKIVGYPVISKPSGVYANSVTVTVKPSMASTTLVYTTDGTNPTPQSQQITSATTFTFTENTILKVGVLMDGQVNDVVTRNYIISDADANSITVYVKADTAFLYAWDDGGAPLNGDWPGTKMTQKRTIGGVEFFYKTFQKTSPEYSINFLLNKGDGDDSKTQDVTGVAGDVFYTFSGNEARDLSNIYLPELYNPFVCIDKPNGDLPANKKVYINASYGDAKNPSVYTADMQRDDFWAYINQDNYLKNRKGQYAERGGAKMPWHHQLDFKYQRDMTLEIGKTKHTLQLGIDIENLPNFLCKDWGLFKQVTGNALLSYNKGKYTYNTVDNARHLSTSQNYLSTASTYQILFTIRYMFN